MSNVNNETFHANDCCDCKYFKCVVNKWCIVVRFRIVSELIEGMLNVMDHG